MAENTEFQNDCLFAVYYLTKIGQRLEGDEPLKSHESFYLGTVVFGMQYVQQHLEDSTEDENQFKHDDDEVFY